MTIDAPDWRSPIIEYLKSPIIEIESKLKIRAARYILVDDILYKKSFSLLYLRCLRLDEAQYALKRSTKAFVASIWAADPSLTRH